MPLMRRFLLIPDDKTNEIGVMENMADWKYTTSTTEENKKTKKTTKGYLYEQITFDWTTDERSGSLELTYRTG